MLAIHCICSHFRVVLRTILYHQLLYDAFISDSVKSHDPINVLRVGINASDNKRIYRVHSMWLWFYLNTWISSYRLWSNFNFYMLLRIKDSRHDDTQDYLACVCIVLSAEVENLVASIFPFCIKYIRISSVKSFNLVICILINSLYEWQVLGWLFNNLDKL